MLEGEGGVSSEGVLTPPANNQSPVKLVAVAAGVAPAETAAPAELADAADMGIHMRHAQNLQQQGSCHRLQTTSQCASGRSSFASALPPPRS